MIVERLYLLQSPTLGEDLKHLELQFSMKACLVLSHNMEFDMNLRIKDAYTGGFIHLQTFNSLTFGVCFPHKYIIKQGSSKI